MHCKVNAAVFSPAFNPYKPPEIQLNKKTNILTYMFLNPAG
jgi:hypothetical protein